MNRLANSLLFRFVASAALASMAIVAIVGIAIRYFDRPDADPELADVEQMRIIDLDEHPRLAEAVRKERERYAQEEPEGPPPLPPTPERQVAGFVHVEYVINPDGSVSDVRVIGAAPRGVYEQQAIAEVSRRMHAPAYNDSGDAVARRATEIVEFSVPASELRNPGLESE